MGIILYLQINLGKNGNIYNVYILLARTQPRLRAEKYSIMCSFDYVGGLFILAISFCWEKSNELRFPSLAHLCGSWVTTRDICEGREGEFERSVHVT